MVTFEDVATQQGWNEASRETVLRNFIEAHPEGGGTAGLAAFAQRVADEENGVPEGSSGKRVPDLQMDVTGTGYDGAYPTPAEYRVTGTTDPEDPEDIVIRTETSDGVEIYRLLCTPAIIDGISRIASTDHSLAGYEDDWSIPAGMDRVVTWEVGATGISSVVLNEGQIDEVAAWLRCATGEDEWDWTEYGSEWEF